MRWGVILTAFMAALLGLASCSTSPKYTSADELLLVCGLPGSSGVSLVTGIHYLMPRSTLPSEVRVGGACELVTQSLLDNGFSLVPSSQRWPPDQFVPDGSSLRGCGVACVIAFYSRAVAD